MPYLPKSLSHPINNFGNAYVNRKLNKNINSDLTAGLIFQSGAEDLLTFDVLLF